MHGTKTLLSSLFIAVTLLCTSAALAQDQTPPDTNNPFISDGTYKTSPFKFKFTVTGVEPDIDNLNLPLLKHFSTEKASAVIDLFSKAYKSQKEIAPGFTVAGSFFQTQKGIQSFTFREKGTNHAMIVDVIEDPNTNGSVIILHARPQPVQKAVWRLSWYGYSPVKGKPYSLTSRTF